MAGKKGTSLVQFDEELARQAQAYRSAEAASATGNFISVRGGIMQWRGSPIEGNKFDAVILASVFENDYHKDAFDPDDPRSPSCYAFSATQDALAPHAEAEDPQGDANKLCAACWANGFGSDPKGGRGKACQNRRRVALIPASNLTPEGVEAAEVAYLRVPVMSVAGYSNHVMQVADTLKRPPCGVVTEVSVVPDAKAQFRVMFKVKGKVEGDALQALFARAAAAAAAIQFPYPKNVDKPARGARRPAARPAPKRAANGGQSAKGAAPAKRF